jgi:hypothetical protein
MPFTYQPGKRLEDVLIEALKFAKRGSEDAIFIFHSINIIVTRRSNLAHIWSGYIGTEEGRTVGPCEETSPDMISLPKGFHDWTAIEREAALATIHVLMEANR